MNKILSLYRQSLIFKKATKFQQSEELLEMILQPFKNKSKTQELGETKVCLFGYRTCFDKLLERYISVYTGVPIHDMLGHADRHSGKPCLGSESNRHVPPIPYLLGWYNKPWLILGLKMSLCCLVKFSMKFLATLSFSSQFFWFFNSFYR